MPRAWPEWLVIGLEAFAISVLCWALASAARAQLPADVLVPFGTSRAVTFGPVDATGSPAAVDGDPTAEHVYRVDVEIDPGCPHLFPVLPTFVGPRQALEVSLYGIEPGCSGRLRVFADADLSTGNNEISGVVSFLVVPPELVDPAVALVPVSVGTVVEPLFDWLQLWATDIRAYGAPAYE